MSNSKTIYVGIDIGSVSANTVVLDEHKNVLEDHYTRTQGAPLETARTMLDGIVEKYGKDSIKLLAATGSGGKLIAPFVGAAFTNEVIAQAKATEHFYPEVRTVIEMGGQDAKVILLAPEDDGSGKVRIEDFQMNSVCAAGTGSFLDQQAIRMELTIEEFGHLALKSKNPPRVAGRCSVFAKSDMIHLQQAAAPDYDIVAGLCFAVARNFKATIGKGKAFLTPIAFQGGVAANEGVKKAFKEILNLDEGDYIIPTHFASMGALGAIFNALEKKKGIGDFKGTAELNDYINEGQKQERSLDQLERPTEHPSMGAATSVGYPLDPDKKVDAYLGVDIGSTSTNVILIDKDRKLIAKRYLKTAGRPLEAVRSGLADVDKECGKFVNIIGVGTTGSGRYLIGDFIGADVVRNEITAQAVAAVDIDPDVDTIFEIGGQDSKYIAINDAVVVDFEMNKVCAAGTGSFLEEQAERLGINIKEEFSDLAIDCAAPPPMGDRCTVFIETDMVHHQQKGVKKGGLVAGLAYSIVHNYLNRVVGDRRIGKKIFFQGGTAANLAVVSAFEYVTGKKIIVPEHHDVTGAIGVAILALQEMDASAKTEFKGFDLSQKKYTVDSFECRDCSNICEVRKVVLEGEDPLYYGGRCEKYDVNMAKAKKSTLPDLFQERDKFLYSSYKGASLPESAPTIGMPRMLTIFELYPFWKAFFNEMGYKVKLSSPTNKDIIKEGVERIVAETCFPVKVAHGHIQELIEKKVEKIFLPSIVDMMPAKENHSNTVLCPYVQAMPYVANTAFDFKAEGVEVIAPVIHFNQKRSLINKEFYALGESLGKTNKSEINKALEVAYAAQANFKDQMIARGKEILDGLAPDDLALVIVGRPYNTVDRGINLELPEKLADMGTLAIPFDMLPVDENISDVLAEDMYWKSGQRILTTAKLLRDDPRLYSIFITNFGCGPDSFITHFYRDASAGKPYLQIEIDEHSADAGAITRCEAYLDSLRNVRKRDAFKVKKEAVVNRTGINKKLYIPNLTDGGYGLAAAFQACGIDAEVMPMPDDESLNMGRKYTSGRECYPTILTTGDMVRFVTSPDFEREKSAFFMPSGNGPCRFGQYNRFQRLILDELGFSDVPIFAPDQDEKFYEELGGAVSSEFPKLGWWGITAIDLLEKKLREVRPYEKNAGDTEKVYWKSVTSVCDAIRDKRFPDKELLGAKEAFNSIDANEYGTLPVVGLVGEIYVRCNRFSNDDLVKNLEANGAEVRLPPFAEWIYYTNFVSKRKNWNKSSYSNFFKTFVNDFFQHKFEKKLGNVFNGDLRSGHEPRIKEILELASPYIHDSFEGEATLSVGKVIDYINGGAHGIVNVMPFTCMPGTIVNGVLKKVKEDNDNIPYLNMVYEGIEDTNAKTRIEAFVHQAKDYKSRRPNKKVVGA